jgi:hypothetical protein
MPALCSHLVDGIVCGKPGVATIKVKQGVLSLNSPKLEEMGRGVGSQWIVVCSQHITMYPDHDGMFLDSHQQ